MRSIELVNVGWTTFLDSGARHSIVVQQIQWQSAVVPQPFDESLSDMTGLE
jgi:hypothetical protein